ncbi:MAG: T9SS type A sorting domain-containing protein [bacterium]|nr:T9SS type A sorting domain-containing protein [bacterium]
MGRILFSFVAVLCIVSVVRAQDSLNVRQLTQLSMTSFGVSVQGSYAYVASGEAGLAVINIGNPTSPSVTGFCDTPGYTFAAVAEGNIVYVIDRFPSALRVIDISNSAAPTESGFWSTPADAYDVDISGSHAYVADSYGLHVIDISNPSSPTQVGFFNTPTFFAFGVAVQDSFAYVALGDGGLFIFNISDPTSPGPPVGFYNISSQAVALGVSVHGMYAYVAYYEDGLRIIDIGDPTNPIEVGYCDTSGDASHVTIANQHAFIADHHGGLRVIDITNPALPMEVGFYDTPGSALDVAVEGSHAYVADNQYFGIYDCSAALHVPSAFAPKPSSFTLAAFPNPFNATTTISFEVPHAERVELKVFDVTGRIAQNLASRVYDAGEYSLLFNGSAFASGVYFVQMQSGEFSKTQKIVLLK